MLIYWVYLASVSLQLGGHRVAAWNQQLSQEGSRYSGNVMGMFPILACWEKPLLYTPPQGVAHLLSCVTDEAVKKLSYSQHEGSEAGAR